MSDSSTNPLVITYAKHVIDFATLPQTSVVAMLRRGVSHFLGNEQSAKVTAYFDPDRKLADGETRLDDSEENRARVKGDFVAKAVDALLAGTVGVSTRGPTVDPIEVEVNRIARKEITDQLKENGVKPPKKSADTVTIGGTAYTMDQLIARRLSGVAPGGVAKDGTSHADRIGKLAAKVMADKAKARAKAAETAKAAGGLDAL